MFLPIFEEGRDVGMRLAIHHPEDIFLTLYFCFAHALHLIHLFRQFLIEYHLI